MNRGQGQTCHRGGLRGRVSVHALMLLYVEKNYLSTPKRACGWLSETGGLEDLTYFFRRATTRTRLVCEMAPGVRASLTISACSCWWRLPEPPAGLALSGRPT